MGAVFSRAVFRGQTSFAGANLRFARLDKIKGDIDLIDLRGASLSDALIGAESPIEKHEHLRGYGLVNGGLTSWNGY